MKAKPDIGFAQRKDLNEFLESGAADRAEKPAAPAAPAPAAAPSAKGEKDNQGRSDNLKHPLAEKQAALRQKALELKLRGKAAGNVVQVAKGQYVELAREDTDRIFVVLAEFGNTRHSSFPDTVNGQPASDALVFDGPLHNQIWQPYRATDNTTLCQAHYNRAHDDDMYCNERYLV